MDREIARRVVDALTLASSEVATTAELVRGEVQDGDFKKYLQAVGVILGSIQLDLMASVLKEYPEFDPDGGFFSAPARAFVESRRLSSTNGETIR